MKNHSFFSDTKLQVEQIKKKWRKSSLSLYLFKNQFKKVEIFLKVETIINFQVKKLKALAWSCLGSQLDMSLSSFHLICSVL